MPQPAALTAAGCLNYPCRIPWLGVTCLVPGKRKIPNQPRVENLRAAENVNGKISSAVGSPTEERTAAGNASTLGIYRIR